MYKFSEELLDMLNSYISRIAKEEVRKAIHNLSVETYQDMKVTKVHEDGSVDVVDIVTGENYCNVSNKSNDDIAINDIVRIYLYSNNKKYIGIKL